MIAKNGSGIIDKIQRLALDTDSFAYLLIDNRGVLLDQGGDLHSLVLPQWHPGENILDSALFLLGYGIFRFLVEFVREPDAHIGFIAFDWVTMGHLLTLPMIVAGIVLLVWAYGNKQRNQSEQPL